MSLPSGRCVCVGLTPRGVYFDRKTAFSEWVLRADGRAVPSCTQCFFGTSVWGWYHYPPAAVAVSEQPRAGVISAEKRLSQSGCSAPTDALFTPAHSAFLAPLCGGWSHYPRRALHAAKTLDARRSRRRIYRFYAVPEFALCGPNIPSADTHATPAPNRAHSGSHAETRRVFTARDIGRVDRVNSLGTLCIVTFGTA